MHELSIALAILDAASEEAARLDGARVLAIHLRFGPLSGVVEEALRSAFELAREGTPFGETSLVFEAVPLVAFCPSCDAERPVASIRHLRCAECGGPASHVVRGRELEVVALEVEP
ncbi:hydrogenase maturation nickel metallochaperone HypA/HybF [Tautonia plasticadhaerens]|uniref:Hydrogenase maturation factor HypA n=1 Tax=Tautonia plasticadhaerens TaxID=2527974 RepID=A0A518H3F8_9BACT|nr:hydrogenase maturation nickel metallochaperone HypA [Tautonia plasticadhaerens]QDV35372.1 hydrogenase nickel incorporation protein HybF [Tautonia plasticadhaerens]